MTRDDVPSSPPPDINPWARIWLQPRRTIRWLVQHDPERQVLLLAGAAGFVGIVDRAILEGLGDHLGWPGILLIGAIIGPILGIIGLLVGAWLLRVTGKALGGQASTGALVTAYAWSSVPAVASLALVAVAIAIFGQELFMARMPRVEAGGLYALAWNGYAALKLLLGLWGIVIFLLAVSEVQRFSVARALGNALLALAVVAVPVFFLSLILVSNLPATATG